MRNDPVDGKAMTEQSTSVAFIGFGEAAAAFLTGWRTEIAVTCTAYDIKTDAPTSAVRDEKFTDYHAATVDGQTTVAGALKNADLVFSVVSPDQALNAARNASSHLGAGILYFDCNSCSPGTK